MSFQETFGLVFCFLITCGVKCVISVLRVTLVMPYRVLLLDHDFLNLLKKLRMLGLHKFYSQWHNEVKDRHYLWHNSVVVCSLRFFTLLYGYVHFTFMSSVDGSSRTNLALTVVVTWFGEVSADLKRDLSFGRSNVSRNCRPAGPQVIRGNHFPGPGGPGWENGWPFGPGKQGIAKSR